MAQYNIINLVRIYRENIYKNSLILIVDSISTSILGFIFWVVATRNNSSEEVGIAIAIVSAITLIVSFSRIGLDVGLMRFYPDTEDKNALYNTVNFVTLLFSIVLTAIFIIGINVFSPSLSFLRQPSYMIIFFALIIFNSVITSQSTAFNSMRRVDISLMQDIIINLKLPLLFILVAIGITGVSGIVISILIGTTIALCYGYVTLRKTLTIKINFDILTLKSIFRYSFSNYVSMILVAIPSSIIPIMIINEVNASACAYFFIAYNIGSILFMIPNAVSTALFIEGCHGKPIKENVIKAFGYILLILVPAVIVIYLFGDKLLLIFSKEYSIQSFEMLKLFAISSLFSSIVSIYISIKKVHKDIISIVLIPLFISLSLIILGYISLIKYGLIGLGYTWILTYAVASLFVLLFSIYIDKWVHIKTITHKIF